MPKEIGGRQRFCEHVRPVEGSGDLVHLHNAAGLQLAHLEEASIDVSRAVKSPQSPPVRSVFPKLRRRKFRMESKKSKNVNFTLLDLKVITSSPLETLGN